MVGPETDIPGIFHGPLFYYLIALPYAASKAEPSLPTFLMVLINLTGIPLLYYLGYSMFKSKKTGILAAFLFAISFQMANYARYLSNASPLPVTTLVFFLGLWLWINEKRAGLPLSILGFGLSSQLEIFYLYLIIFYPIIYCLWKPKTPKNSLFYSLLTGVAVFSTFLIAEVKFKLLGIRSFLSYFLSQGEQEISLMGTIDSYASRFLETLKYNLFAWSLIYALFLFLIVLFYIRYFRKLSLREDKPLFFLVIWIFSTIPLFGFSSQVHNTPVINSSLPAAIFILFAYFLTIILRKREFLILSLVLTSVISGNLFLFANSEYLSIFKIANGSTWENEKQIIDYIYQKSEKEPFSVCAVTAPLFIDTTWSYLFEHYGKEKYGLLPLWAGSRDKASLGHLSQDNIHPKKRFLIIEGGAIVPEKAVKLTLLHENTISEKLEKQSFEGITIEYRELLNEEERVRRKKESQKENKEDWLMFEKDPRYSCFF